MYPMNRKKKTVALLAGGVLLFAVGGFALSAWYESRMDALEDRYEQAIQRQAAPINQGQSGALTQESRPSSPVSGESQQTPSTAYGIALVDQSELDGTYTATMGRDVYTLTIKGNQGTLLEVEPDGEQNIDEVVFDLEKKVAYIDGEVEEYHFDGRTLTLTELDRDAFDQDKLVFTRN